MLHFILVFSPSSVVIIIVVIVSMIIILFTASVTVFTKHWSSLAVVNNLELKSCNSRPLHALVNTN